MDELRARLQDELDTVDWRALRGHLRRDCLILVAPELDLVEVACCVAGGRLRKPGADELTAWERELDKPFRMLIVAPYVLIQAV
jgi:hypothetical protein